MVNSPFSNPSSTPWAPPGSTSPHHSTCASTVALSCGSLTQKMSLPPDASLNQPRGTAIVNPSPRNPTKPGGAGTVDVAGFLAPPWAPSHGRTNQALLVAKTPTTARRATICLRLVGPGTRTGTGSAT